MEHVDQTSPVALSEEERALRHLQDERSGLHPLHETKYLSTKVERIPKGEVPYDDYTQEIYP